MTLLQPLALALAAVPNGDPGDTWITLETELSRPAQEAPPEAGAQPEAKGGWDFVIRPYVWFPNFDGEVGVGSIPPGTVRKNGHEDVKPGVIVGLDTLRRDSSWGLMFELLWLELEADSSSDSADLDHVSFEADFFYRLPDLPNTDLYIGLRYWNLGLDLSTTDPLPTNESDTANFLDPVFGARTAIPIGEKWRFRARGDVAGLGLGSNLTWGGSVSVAREIAKNGEIDLGWRFLDLTYDDQFDVDGQYSGLILGLIWGF
jgi:hypothetical protein